MLNFEDTKSASILDGVNPSNQIAVIKNLPNQLKSLALATSDIVLSNPFRAPSLKEPSENRPPVEGPPWFFRPENMAKIWQMFQNIVGIEYLFRFDTPKFQVQSSSGELVNALGNRDLLKAPRWLPLNREVISMLEEGDRKIALLCRIKKYKNSKLGIGTATKKDMPIIDQYFTLGS